MNRALFLIAFVVFPVTNSWARTFFTGEVGYLTLRQAPALENRVSPRGPSFGGGLGFRQQYYEFEAKFLSSTAEDDVIHDDQKNTMVHEQKSYLLGFNFYLTKSIYLRAGYGMTRVNQTLKKEVSAASEAGAKKSYGLAENKVTDGPLFGGGFVFLDRRSLLLYTQLEYMSFASLKGGAWNASLGFRFYFGK